MPQQLPKPLLLVLLYLTSLIFNLSYSQSVVCRLASISGFEEECTKGHSICGETTNSMANTKIYMTVKDDQLFVASNYINTGFNFPTKLANSESMASADEIAMNIFFTAYPSEARLADMRENLRNDIEVVVDPKLLNSRKYGSIDFDGVGHVKILCPDDEARDAIKIKNADGSVEFGVKYNNQFSTRVKDQNLDFIFSELVNRKIDFNNIRIINLVENNKTKQILDLKFGEKKVDFDYSSAENFKKLLLANKGKRTVILGHIEDGDFVTLRSGQEVFRISISEIQSFQKENKLELILLGCHSANEGAGSGPLNKFNSIDALNRLEKTEKTQNVEEFLDSLSMGTIHFLVDETFFRTYNEPVFRESNDIPELIDIAVYDNSKGKISSINASTPKGRIIFLGLGTLEYVNAVIPPFSADTATDHTKPVGSDSGSIDPNVIISPKPNSKDKTNFIAISVLVIAVIGIIFYIVKSPN